ncbi:MAG TPA: hypothetical protein VKV95_17790 [Terriglobia bacterium]|nr:hypothetical protein [Terriglobia bacterium]
MLQLEKQISTTNRDFIPPAAIGSNDPALGRLLPLFPSAKPANIPIRLGLPTRAKGAAEKTTIMFRGHDTVIFMVNYPLYGGEEVQLRQSAGPREASAKVVALMPNERGAAVAVRFFEEIPKWIFKA